MATDLVERLRPAGSDAGIGWHGCGSCHAPLLGMMLAHLGMAVFVFGVTMVKTYEVERDVKMDVGDTTEVAGYTFTFRGVRDVPGPNYAAAQGLRRGHARRPGRRHRCAPRSASTACSRTR